MPGNPQHLEREPLQRLQLRKLRRMLGPILRGNAFYREKLQQAGLLRPEELGAMAAYRKLPFTTRAELSADQEARPPYGTNLTFALEHYIRLHQTSGSAGARLRWLDTEQSWAWFARCWATVYEAAGVGARDRIFFAFSFGPFIGFWSGYEGARLVGALSIPGGGMSSEERLRVMQANGATVLVCTPTYALHLAAAAAECGIDLASSSIRTTVHAGEAGAGLPATRARIERAWGARCYDHAGATEVGAWGFECRAQAGLHFNEAEFICEVVDPHTGAAAEEGELVITNLGRVGMPLIRYRTGDRVKLDRAPCACGRTFWRAEGGVVGRLDEALIVRGILFFPSALENIVRRFPQVGEFAVDLHRRRELDEMELRLEVDGGEAAAVAAAVGKEVRHAIGLRAHIEVVPPGTLPRFELKARRFRDHRRQGGSLQ